MGRQWVVCPKCKSHDEWIFVDRIVKTMENMQCKTCHQVWPTWAVAAPRKAEGAKAVDSQKRPPKRAKQPEGGDEPSENALQKQLREGKATHGPEWVVAFLLVHPEITDTEEDKKSPTIEEAARREKACAHNHQATLGLFTQYEERLQKLRERLDREAEELVQAREELAACAARFAPPVAPQVAAAALPATQGRLFLAEDFELSKEQMSVLDQADIAAYQVQMAKARGAVVALDDATKAIREGKEGMEARLKQADELIKKRKADQGNGLDPMDVQVAEGGVSAAVAAGPGTEAAAASSTQQKPQALPPVPEVSSAEEDEESAAKVRREARKEQLRAESLAKAQEKQDKKDGKKAGPAKPKATARQTVDAGDKLGPGAGGHA